MLVQPKESDSIEFLLNQGIICLYHAQPKFRLILFQRTVFGQSINESKLGNANGFAASFRTIFVLLRS